MDPTIERLARSHSLEKTVVMHPKHLTLLRLHDACRGLSVDEIEAIAAEVDVMEMGAGELVHSVGQDLDAVYIVVSGRLKMTIKTPGGKQRTVRYISAGDQFGALMLVTEEDFPVDVIVDEKAVLLRLRKEIALQLFDRFPVFRRNFLRKLGHGVHDLMDRRRRPTLSKIVAFIHADDQCRKLVAEIASRLARIGEKVGIVCDSNARSQFGADVPFKSLRDQAGDYIDYSEVQSTIQQWPDLDRIILIVDPSCPSERLARLFEMSDAVFCFARTEHFLPAVNDLQRVIEGAPSWTKKTHLIWVLRQDEQIAPLAPELRSLTQRDFKVQLRETQAETRLHAQGIDRLVHHLRGLSIGVALSGGAAHGMAHLGVLRAMEEAGITIDRIAGTSAGVLTGVLYCAGYSSDWGIKVFTHDLEPGSFYKWFPKGAGLYLLNKYRSRSWNKMLRRYLRDWRLEQLPIPVSTVTTDLISAQSVTRSSGDAVDSILESINLPVLSPPICRDGMLLVDGGIINNLPADLLVEQGCNFVIGVDVAANVEHRVGENFPSTPTSKMKTPGMVTTMLRCLTVQAHNMSAVGASPADVIIAPDVSMFEPTAFTKTPEMAEIGYRATKESLPRIREILLELDEDLFRE
jgi:NTE family protein